MITYARQHNSGGLLTMAPAEIWELWENGILTVGEMLDYQDRKGIYFDQDGTPHDWEGTPE